VLLLSEIRGWTVKTCRAAGRAQSPRAGSHVPSLLIMCLDAKGRRLLRQLLIYQAGVRVRYSAPHPSFPHSPPHYGPVASLPVNVCRRL
jgi:hypothetical protein